MVPWGPKIETGYLDRPQLYADSDTGELHNVATQHPEKVKRMDEIIQAVRKNDKAALDSLQASPALAPSRPLQELQSEISAYSYRIAIKNS